DVGAMVTIGRNAAVVRMGKRDFTGFLAWLVWLVVHILNLIGFRNRMIVMLNWALDYIFSDRAVRLILPFKKIWYNKKD
ncbi:MAG: FAD-dependent oxidoreductase, partial [Nitrospirae bacterium]|nr:FAD-dependent oxidoreductase [Nitrospirota bacterium]